MKKEYYKFIDILKLVFAICIVAIHTNVSSDFSNDFQWYTYTLILRIGVPFFFVSSGFFFGKKCLQDPSNIGCICRNQIKRLLIPFAFWMVVSLPYIFISTKMNESFINTIIIIFQKIVFYPWGALWYVLATVVAILILRLFIKKNRIRLALFLGALSFVICLLGNSYYFILEGTVFQRIMDFYLKICISTRNGLFTGFPLFTLGYYIATKENSIQRIQTIYLVFFLILSFLIQFFEVSKIRYLSIEYDYFIMTIPIVLVILSLCIKLKSISINYDTKIFRNLSASIYFMHRPIIYYFSGALMVLKIDFSNITVFLIVLSIIIVSIIPLYRINNKYINLILK